jgi:hypothetical protein
MANKFWTLTGIAVLALVFGARPAIAQTTGERDHAGGQADETEGQQGAKDNAGKTNKQGKSKDKNNGKAGKQGQGGAANNPGANGGGTAETGGTGGATPK